MDDALNAFDKTMNTTLAADQSEMVLPLHEESISVTKRVVEKDLVRVFRTTKQSEQLVDELLKQEHVEIERNAIGKPIDQMPSVREEGDTIIIPVVEEILVVERRLILKEEVHVRRVRAEERHQERVVLRKQEAEVIRVPVAKSAGV